MKMVPTARPSNQWLTYWLKLIRKTKLWLINWYLNPSTGTHVPKICGVWTKLWVYYIGNVGNVPCWDYSTSPLDVWQRWYARSCMHMSFLSGIEVYIWDLCVYIYIVHIDIGMYLWWVVNVRWGRFASLLLLCERDLHYGICSGILNPNRPQTCTNSKLFAIGWDSIRLGWSETMHKQQPERQQYPYTPNSIWHCLKLKHVYISGSEGWCCSGGYSHHIWRVWENLGTDMYFCVDVLFRPFWSLVCFTQQGSMDPHDKFVRKGLRPQTILPYSAWSFVSTYWTMFFFARIYIYIYIYIYTVHRLVVWNMFYFSIHWEE
jgi:hypothetical protein